MSLQPLLLCGPQSGEEAKRLHNPCLLGPRCGGEINVATKEYREGGGV